MSEKRIRPYRCTCTECDPLPPIENLHPASFDEHPQEAKVRALLQALAIRIKPIGRAS